MRHQKNPHPSQIVNREFRALNTTISEFARRMGLSYHRTRRLLGRTERLTAINADIALRLEKVLGPPACFWTNAQRLYDEEQLIDSRKCAHQNAKGARQ